MNILENYNNAKQKYGIEIVELFTKLGLPPQYLLSACRFQTEYHMPFERIVQLFRDWTKYVVKYSQVDVNTKTFVEFMQLIAQGKKEHLLPHILYKDEECILYSINNIKDARNLPNDYCIKAVRKYNVLKNDGYSFILIFLPNQQFPYTFVVASIHNGIVEYWDAQNYKLYNNEADNYRYEQYESLLPNEAKAIIHSTNANNQKNKHINMKNRIRLNESQLHRVIKESVKKVLMENLEKTSLRDFMKSYYDNDKSCNDALRKLTDKVWLASMGWEQVFHEGIGDGVYSPRENIVAVFDEDDLPTYHSYHLYKFNPKAWKNTSGNGWDRIYNGDNGNEYGVEDAEY